MEFRRLLKQTRDARHLLSKTQSSFEHLMLELNEEDRKEKVNNHPDYYRQDTLISLLMEEEEKVKRLQVNYDFLLLRLKNGTRHVG